ncbi:cell wall hydrolase [Sphingobium sufflavum]|uniref:cell wall hydrolase n=1 Tax=Sphingobium sufflavum TaxID=1129547 RepID=UPI001F31ADD0|nr:cell wall hydrolase [Sphingobium sufflavum]MCE7795863.1 cell wall hydrolase [Sphingobium sufflavum]
MASVPIPPRPDAPSPGRPSPTGRSNAPAWTARRARRNGRWRRGWTGAAIALLLALLLRLIPEQALLALDHNALETAQPLTPVQALPPQGPGDTFPGSAYFLAQDAFAPVDAAPVRPGDPAVTTLAPEQRSPHVLQIDHGPAALSMPMRGLTFLDQARALQCMTNAIYYEAGNEPEEGQRAVAQVILNRLASGRWPASVCGVIYQGTERSDLRCQFTFSCDGSMARAPAASTWARARRIAARSLSGEIFAPAGLATFYHTLAVHPPWAGRVRPVAVIGAHIFYRLPGEAGMPATYRMRYSGRETAQPGPYAFTPPSRTLPPLAPPGPDLMAGWSAPTASVPTAATATASPLLLPQPAAVPSLATAMPALPAPAPSAHGRDPGSPGLPQSTIRPEYRNSGRALR